MRCFIAICIPDVIKESLFELQKRLKSPDISGAKISWTRLESFHLTLKFLGELGEQATSRVATAVEKSVEGISPFQVHVQGVSVFPNPSAPQILWAGIADPVGKLKELQHRVDQVTDTLGFPSERRKFTPHLTLGRVRFLRESEEVNRRMGENREIQMDPFQVREVCLMQSILWPEGSEYRTIQVLPLREEQNHGQ